VYGNKFIIQDHSGRMLVEMGHHHEGENVVAKGEIVTIQGDFDDDFIRASVMTRADGSTVAFGSPRRHRHEHGDDGHGPDADRDTGPDNGPGPQPAPPPSQH